MFREELLQNIFEALLFFNFCESMRCCVYSRTLFVPWDDCHVFPFALSDWQCETGRKKKKTWNGRACRAVHHLDVLQLLSQKRRETDVAKKEKKNFLLVLFFQFSSRAISALAGSPSRAWSNDRFLFCCPFCAHRACRPCESRPGGLVPRHGRRGSGLQLEKKKEKREKKKTSAAASLAASLCLCLLSFLWLGWWC